MAKKFCGSNLLDVESVSLVMNKLSETKQLMPKIDYQDKWPNIDGYVYLLEQPLNESKDCLESFGTIEIQIKKLPDKHELKFSLETAYLDYARNKTINPVILLASDCKSKEVFWIHLSEELISSYESKLSQGSITIDLNKNQVINKTTPSLWLDIYSRQKNKVVGFDKIKEINDSYSIISNNSIAIPEKESSNFIKIHKFLDKLNSLLDGDYNLIKNIFYKNVWKLGFAYGAYEENKITYSFFPVYQNQNDVLIKRFELGPNIPQHLPFISSNYHKNIIEEESDEEIKDFIKQNIKKIFRNILFEIDSDEVIMEYLFGLTSYYHKEFGLEKKSEYSLDEISNGFNIYFPIWVEEMYKIKKMKLDPYTTVEAKSGFIFVRGDDEKKLKENIRVRIEKKDFFSNSFILSDKQYGFPTFIKFLNFAKNKKMKKIKSPFKEGEKDSSTKSSHWIWEKYSKQELKENVKTLFSLLPKLYDELLSKNFPLLYGKINLFNNCREEFDKIIIVIKNAKDEYEKSYSPPSIDYYYLKDSSITERKFEVYLKEDLPIKYKEFPSNSWKKTESLDFIFRPNPILTYASNLIMERNLNYLKEKNIN
jgi:hypothetical protein